MSQHLNQKPVEAPLNLQSYAKNQSENKVLPVGTKIKFLKDLTEGPCEDHPGCIFAREGEFGEVTGHDCSEGHMVKWDAWPNSFGAFYGNEFVEATE